MSVKILHRRSKLSPTHTISILPNLSTPSEKSILGNITENVDSLFKHRKSASGNPLSVAERISEFIHFNKPNIDIGSISPLIQKLKVPGLILVGVAFIAGLAYMAYRLYSNWSEKKADETINKIMKDFSESTPELLQLPGWYDQVRNEVAEAVNSKNDTYMVEQITRIKTSMIEKQKSMGHPVGSGIDFFGYSKKGNHKLHKQMKNMHLSSYSGGGMVMPLSY